VANQIEAVIFDMDGTVMNSELLWHIITVETLQKRDIDTSKPENKLFLDSLHGISTIGKWEKIKQRFNFGDSIEDLMATDFENAMDVFTDRVSLVEGFSPFHQQLQQQNIPSAIATNAPLHHLVRIAEKMCLKPFFGEHLYSITHVDNKAKPDPAVFLFAAEKLKVAPSACVVFEDSLRGFEAATAAGMRCIAIKNSLNSEHLSHVHAAIDTYHEALDALRTVREITWPKSAQTSSGSSTALKTPFS